MLASSAIILGYLTKSSSEGGISWTLNNALLNSFAIHARNLINFLYSRTRGKDRETDIIIEDYISPAIVQSALIPITPLMEEALKKSTKQVAHLTKERIDYEISGKAWSFIQLVNEIFRAFSSISSHIPDLKNKR